MQTSRQSMQTKGGGLVRSGDERDPTEGFRFVSDHQADYPTAAMCRLLYLPQRLLRMASAVAVGTDHAKGWRACFQRPTGRHD
jgi:hypothetical protein